MQTIQKFRLGSSLRIEYQIGSSIRNRISKLRRSLINTMFLLDIYSPHLGSLLRHMICYQELFLWSWSLTKLDYFSGHFFGICKVIYYLWSPHGIGRPYIFSCCALFFPSLWSPYVIGQTIYIFILFLSFFFFLFFPRLISVVGDWMSTILRHMVWS